MELDETLSQVSKRSRSINGVGIRAQRNKVKRRHIAGEDEDGEEEEENTRAWHSSRIFRVSRASGGKDRHSKVLTAKGLRDRRVRLSVPTAIQFYDLQDRLGYDQPSKAVEWLIKAAADAIADLPSLNGTFPNRTKAPSAALLANHAHSPPNDSLNESGKEDVGGTIGSEPGVEPDPETEPTQRHLSASLTKSACSSTSETSKGSVPSLSRSESRVKARERARKRAEEKEKVVSSVSIKNTIQTLNHNPRSSFTELLMDVNPISVAQQNPNFAYKLHKQAVGSKRPETSLAFAAAHHASPAMDCFNPGIFSSGLLQPSKTHSSAVSSQHHFTNPSSLMGIAPFNPLGFIDHSEMQQFSLLPDHLIPVASSNDYNLNFSMPSLAGYTRGTLQSNSSPIPHIQKFSSPISSDGPNMPFFIGNTAAAAAAAAVAAENQFPGGLDGRLQLCYGEGCRRSDLKGKGKS